MKNMAAVIAVSVAVSMCSVTALAIDDPNTQKVDSNDALLSVNDEKGVIEENKNTGEIKTNKGTVETNNGIVETNNGTVETNNSVIFKNDTNGTVETNNEYISTNNGTIGDKNDNDTGNNGHVNTNNGEITSNNEKGEVTTNNGKIDTNEGFVQSNTKDGTVDKNVEHGQIRNNYGTIKENSAKADTSDIPQNTVYEGGVESNYGTIEENSGFVQDNGKQAEGSDPAQDGLIKNNEGTVITNHSEIDNNSGYVDTNGYVQFDQSTGKESPNPNAIVKNNTGIVGTNNGVVENYEHGIVGHNNGIVYNYGGEITGKKYDSKGNESDGPGLGAGTEYFSVSVTTTNGSQSYTGFHEYDKVNWLGRTPTYNEESRSYEYGTNSEKGTITVTPSSGYQIENFNIPKDYEKYITATKNSDGSWTLNVTSGYNIALTPTATLIGGSTSGTTDPVNTDKETPSGDTSGNKDTPKTITVDISVSSDSDSGNDNGSSGGMMNGLSNPQPTVTDGFSQNNMMTPLTINSVDFMGQGLSASVADVLKPIDNITAMNNFTAMGTQLPSTENMMVCGVVDFKNAFVNAATGSIDVPVEASVIAGNYYTVALSDGTTIQVKCETNGVLNIPFAANAQNLTFIVYGMQVNPAMLLAGETDQFQDALAGLTP